MAGNKVNAKTKTKEEKGKTNRNSCPANEDEDLDFSILRKSIHTSVTGFAQARKVFDLATEELKSLLTTECDILYECKVCRNIFRSLANFISHKRMYCKERFDTSVHGHFVRTLSVASEISRIKKLEALYNDTLKDDLVIVNQKEIDDRIPLTKDLTEIIERLASAKGKPQQVENPQVVLQKIPKSNVAVFQNIRNNDNDTTDLIREEVHELNALMSRESAVIHNNGKVDVQNCLPPRKAKETESVIQISDDEEMYEGDILKCKICDLQFSTQKTLKFHMKYKHVDSRLVYPCPDCLEIFSTSWSVYRHLFKVHRKTAAQIRRLRESIQAKAFKMDNPPAFYERRKNNAKTMTAQKITEEQRLDQENQAWMDNLEGDGEVPRCGGCGRTFERRAALAAHTHTCQTRSRALARRPPDTRKIEIQIRKDYNKAPSALVTLPIKPSDYSCDNKPSNEPEQPKLQQDAEKEPVEEEEEEKSKDTHKSKDSLLSKRSTDDTSPNNKNKANDNKNTNKLRFARLTELSNFKAFSKQCESEIDLDKLQCKKCESKFTKIGDLYDHMAEHYKWLRYACKLCNFKHYSFEKLPEHVQVVHKLKGELDFYYSTVKAIDGTEALQLSECSKDTNESTETSPDSRRPSRCSSDSSRLSDDSSSSSSRVEGSKKRKMKTNKIPAKKKKETITIEDNDGLRDSEGSNDIPEENDSTSNVKVFEELSSDIEEVEEKSTKKPDDKSTTILSSRRPIRKRTNKKNEDFEYDLSNLLKMEAQGYRDSQSMVASKTIPNRKKTVVENHNNTEINKDCCGALAYLSSKAVASALAHWKHVSSHTQSELRTSNVFLRPLLPKVGRVEKTSPKKDTPTQIQDLSSPNKAPKQEESSATNLENPVKEETKQQECSKMPDKEVTTTNSPSEDKTKPANVISEPSTTKLNVPTVVPLKLRRQSLDLIKNPIIKKKITDFSKAGMKTKILVIKPINRNKDGGKTINNPLKFQTIKLKDPNKTSISDNEKSTDQVRIVQVPNVDCTTLPLTSASKVKKDINVSAEKPDNTDVVEDIVNNSESDSGKILEKSKTEDDISEVIKTTSCTNKETEPCIKTLSRAEELLSENES